MDFYDSMRNKVDAIFRELAGDRAERLNWIAKDVIARIKGIYKARYGPHVASTFGHAHDGLECRRRFIVALCLYPDRFSDEEIEAGIAMFLTHAPTTSVPRVKSQARTCGKIFLMMSTNRGRMLQIILLRDASRFKSPLRLPHWRAPS